MAVPWRAAEAMHWQLGDLDIARRAGVVPFSLSGASMDVARRPRQPSSPSRRPLNSQSDSNNIHTAGSTGPWCNILTSSSSPIRPSRASRLSVAGYTGLVARKMGNDPSQFVPSSPKDDQPTAYVRGGMPMRVRRRGSMLPSVAELVAGVGPYEMPEMTGVTVTGLPLQGPSRYQ